MATDWFRNHPLVEYRGVVSRNVMLRAALARGVLEKYGVFYPYRVKDWERPDTIAFDYYGDSRFAWLVYLANDVIDPYTDWPMCDADFNAYIADKYGSYEQAVTKLHHYESDTVLHWMTPETYAHATEAERAGFNRQVSYWDWENVRNEQKKNIRLLSRRYAAQAENDLTRVFAGDRI